MNRSTDIRIGKIGRPKGLSGEVYVDLYNTQSDLFAVLQEVRAGDAWANILEAGPQSGRWVIRLEGFDTREAAESLTGKELWVRRDQLPELPAGEYYCFDLEGLSVQTEDGSAIGTLRSILPTASNDVYIVETKEGQELLLPATREVVRKIDITKGAVTVRIPEVVSAV